MNRVRLGLVDFSPDSVPANTYVHVYISIYCSFYYSAVSKFRNIFNKQQTLDELSLQRGRRIDQSQIKEIFDYEDENIQMTYCCRGLACGLENTTGEWSPMLHSSSSSPSSHSFHTHTKRKREKRFPPAKQIPKLVSQQVGSISRRWNSFKLALHLFMFF